MAFRDDPEQDSGMKVMPFGFPPERAFSFTGIPIPPRLQGLAQETAECDSTSARL